MVMNCIFPVCVHLDSQNNCLKAGSSAKPPDLFVYIFKPHFSPHWRPKAVYNIIPPTSVSSSQQQLGELGLGQKELLIQSQPVSFHGRLRDST